MSLVPQPTWLPTTPPSVGPSSDAEIPACGMAIDAPASPRSLEAGGIAAFHDAKGVSIYDISTDTVQAFEETAALSGSRARLRTREVVSFVHAREPPDEQHIVSQDSLFELDLERRAVTEILRLPAGLQAYDWSPDGTLLAYQLRLDSPTQIVPRLLCLFDARRGTTSQLRSIERPFGTGTGQRESTLVEWSPNGRLILALETTAQPSMFVVDIDGHDVVDPRDGTFARWLSGERVLFQEHPHSDEVAGWATLSTTTGRTRTFGLPDRAYRPSLSPGANQIAFDDGRAEPSVYVFDIEQRTIQRLARGFVAPVWLGSGVIAASDAEPNSSFGPNPWSLSGTTHQIDTSTGEVSELSLPTTLLDEKRYGVIDVLVGS